MLCTRLEDQKHRRSRVRKRDLISAANALHKPGRSKTSSRLQVIDGCLYDSQGAAAHREDPRYQRMTSHSLHTPRGSKDMDEIECEQ